jgi:hypothetical protein
VPVSDSCLNAVFETETYDSAVLAVFRSSSCTSLQCVAQSDFVPKNTLTWQATVGETYYVVVGKSSYSLGGDFTLNIMVSHL